MRSPRSDKILITGAILLLILSLWGLRNPWGLLDVLEEGTPLGHVHSFRGDVRRRSHQEIQFKAAHLKQTLFENDAVFVGDDSQAMLFLDGGQVDVGANSLIILRREKHDSFLDLEYGTLLATLRPGKRQKIASLGQLPVEVKPGKKARVSIQKVQGGQAELTIVEGELDVSVNGEQRKVRAGAKVRMGEASPQIEDAPKPEIEIVSAPPPEPTPTPPPPEPYQVVLDEPTHDLNLKSRDSLNLPLKWHEIGQWTAAYGELLLEVSLDRDFAFIDRAIDVKSDQPTTLSLAQTGEYHYRIRRTTGPSSISRKVNFVRFLAPEIVQPMHAVGYTEWGTRGPVWIEYTRPDKSVALELEINGLRSPLNAGPQRVELDVGVYRLRARAIYEGDEVSDWSPITRFELKARPQAPTLPLARIEKPRTPYRAPIEKVKPIVQAQRSPAQTQITPPPPLASSTLTGQGRVRPQPDMPFGFWVWLGTGYNFVDYRQQVLGRVDLNYQDLRGPSQYLEVGYINSNGLGGVGAYKTTPGNVAFSNYPISRQDYRWRTLSAEILKQYSAKIWDIGQLIYGVRAGIQIHQVPFIFFDASQRLDLREVDMSTASLGALADLKRGKWIYHWMMRYQYPTSTGASGGAFTVKPRFAFDGSLGMSRYFGKRFKGGLFWYGQWHNYGFTYTDGSVTNFGTQGLFYSNLDVRLGYDF